MGVISVRLNKDEEEILKRLSEHYQIDRSTLIKKSLHELYENVVDLEVIKRFESREKEGKVSFYTSEDILNEV